MDTHTLVALARAVTAALPAASCEDKLLLLAWLDEILPSKASLQAALARRQLAEMRTQVH